MTTANLSDHARERLQEELEVLRAQRTALTDGLEDLDATGDRMDDAETIRRADEASILDERIAELVRMLAGGHPIAPETDGPELATGSRLTLRWSDGSEQTLRAVAITEEIRPGEEDTVITVDSPLGRALAGHGPGDSVDYDTPEGTRRVEIVEIAAD